MMISVALELRVEGGRVSHSWRMCVGSNGFGGLVVGAGMEVVDGIHCGQSKGGWSYVGKCRSTSRVLGED